jgi:hypothetical protein
VLAIKLLNGQPARVSVVAGWYKYVPELTVKGVECKDIPAFSVRPDWADGIRQVAMKAIPDRSARFFIAPESRHVR